MSIKASGNRYHLCFMLAQELGDAVNKLLSVIGFRMKIGHLGYTLKDIGCAITEVKIDVQHHCHPKLVLFPEEYKGQ